MVNIVGFMPTTLLDYPGKVACSIFMGGCNFRCPYCQNASLVLTENEYSTNGLKKIKNCSQNPKHFSEDEILNFLQKRKNILDGVCITGGEPTLQKDLFEFIFQIKNLGYNVKLDTNGYRPDILQRLIDGNLIDYVAMDIKSSKAGYHLATGLNSTFDISPISVSVELLKKGKLPYEFRTTLVKGIHTEQDIYDLADWLENAKAYYLQSYKDSDYTIQKMKESKILSSSSCSNKLNIEENITFAPFSPKELEHFLLILQNKIPNTSLRGVD